VVTLSNISRDALIYIGRKDLAVQFIIKKENMIKEQALQGLLFGF